MILLLLAVILPVSILFFSNRRKRLQSARYPPGPPPLPFIGNLHQFDTSNPHINLWRLAKKYGPIMFMKLGSKPVLVVSSPRIAKQVLKTQDLVFCSRPRHVGRYKLSYNGSDIGYAPYGESWRELRKISVLHLLSSKQVQSFRPVREDEVFRMIRDLSVRASSGEVADLSSIIVDLTSTLICRTANEEGSARRRFHELLTESQAMKGGFFLSDYMPSLSWMDKLTGMISRLDKIYKDLDEFHQELIDDHLDPNRPKSVNLDLLDLLIQLKEENLCSIHLTWNHIKAVLMDIFNAGTETMATTIIGVMTTLIKNPTIMRKLQIIKESLRLDPPAPLLVPRETLEKCNIDGYIIPPKTLVHINAWAIARDPEYWEHPNEFVPERFLNTNVDIIGQDFQVIPFGAGRRGCPGIMMALVTVELVLANLLYTFDWELPVGMKSEDIDTELLPGITMCKKNPLCLVPRQFKYCI
ncbi:UNVERIFIED_CONTAM: cytochrome [Sesamum radiatum]|uniref:Cytochrome n=1 Tax=Sesamum radiatum TaxID=300843 RepID=A0AAW2T2N6_SESRA